MVYGRTYRLSGILLDTGYLSGGSGEYAASGSNPVCPWYRHLWNVPCHYHTSGQKAALRAYRIAFICDSKLFAAMQAVVPVSSGFVIIICTIAASAFGAWFFPVEEVQHD